MHTTTLATGFAVKIEGVDLAAPMDDAALERLRALWMKFKIAVFPAQVLDDDALIAFTRRLGPLFVHAQTQLLSKRKEMMELSNVSEGERPITSELGWHSDQSYTPKPVFGTILYGVEAPQVGGETVFADLAAAYTSLPDALRERVEGVEAVYSASPTKSARDVPLNEEERARIVDVSHPLIRTHPYLNRKALYLSPTHIKTIGALSQAESARLIEELTAHAEKPEHLYRHKWTVGDVVMWDNTSVMHRRTAFGPEQRRHLKRTGFYLPDELATPF